MGQPRSDQQQNRDHVNVVFYYEECVCCICLDETKRSWWIEHAHQKRSTYTKCAGYWSVFVCQEIWSRTTKTYTTPIAKQEYGSTQ